MFISYRISVVLALFLLFHLLALMLVDKHPPNPVNVYLTYWRHLIKDRQESFLVSGHSFRIGEVVEEKEGEIHHLQAPRSYL